MGLFNLLKSNSAKQAARYITAVKNVLHRKIEDKLDASEAKFQATPQKNKTISPFEALSQELIRNLNQFLLIKKEPIIGYQPIDLFPTSVLINHQKSFNLSEKSKSHLSKAYKFLSDCNEELKALEMSKEGFINGNLSEDLFDRGELILRHALESIPTHK